MSTKQYRDTHKEQIKEYSRQHKDKNRIYLETHIEKLKITRKEYDRIKGLKYHYNITLEDYDEMFNRQSGLCAICGIPHTELRKRLGVDHDHISGKVRGLLCDSCNRMLGYGRDRIDIFQNAVVYLKGYKEL